jgi:hypothetical protein
VEARRTVPLIVVAIALTAVAVLFGTGERAEGPPEARLELVGKGQVVFDWSREACSGAQAADLPVRAFRDARGRVQLLLSHFVNFRLVGPSLSRLQADCRPVMGSARDGDPAAYRDRQWIASLHTEDGRRIWALVHDEYQGHRHPGRCPGGGYFRCWYNAVTLVESRDEGRTYRARRDAGADLVAGAPFRYRPGDGPLGAFSPSNIVRGPNGRLYALVRVKDRDRRGVCLIRARRIEDARSWQAWDGEGFGGAFVDPYRGRPRQHADCALVAPGEIAEMSGSLTYNEEIGAYLLLDMTPSADVGARSQVTGIHYSTSEDLVEWSPRRLLLRAPSVHSFRCGGRAPIAYPSLIDPSSRSRTFATADGRAFLYYTRFHYRDCRKTADRDLVRVPVEVSE